MIKRFLLTTLLLLLWTTAHAQSTVTFKTANLQHGMGTDGVTNYGRQITKLMEDKPDIIFVQERTTGDTGWDSPMSSAGLAEAVYRENAPAPDQGDGPAIWYKSSKVTKLQTWSHDLNTGTNPSCGTANLGNDCSTRVTKAAVAAKFQYGRFRFYVVNTHLCWSLCNNSTSTTLSVQRENQIADLLSWTVTITGGDPNVVFGGDFNLAPDSPKIGGGFQKDYFTAAGYTDMWSAGVSAGRATTPWLDRDANGVADMTVSDSGTNNVQTHDNRRIDWFWLNTAATVLRLNTISVPDSRATCSVALTSNQPSGSSAFKECPSVSQLWDITSDQGIRVSDHNFITLTLSLPPPTSYNVPTNRTAFPEPALTGALDLTQPGRGAGYTFIDPTFGTTITRCTDEHFWPDEPGKNHMPPDTAEVRSMSINSTKLYVMNIEGGGITPLAWSGSPKQCVRLGDTSIARGGITLVGAITGGSALPSWSGKDDDYLWGTNGYELRRFDFSGLTSTSTSVPFTAVANYATIYNTVTGGTLSGGVCSLGVSGVAAANDFIVTAIQGNQDDWKKAVWYNTADGSYKVLDSGVSPVRWWSSTTNSWTNFTGTTGNWDMHNVKITKEGRYVLITVANTEDDFVTPEFTGTGNGYFAVWDTTNNTLIFTSTAYDGGHRSGGVGYQINQYANGSDASQWVLRDLTNSTTYNSPSFLISPLLSDASSVPQHTALNPDFDEHSSWETARAEAFYPAFSLTSRTIAVDGSHPWRAWENEGLAVRTDATGNNSVFRFFHTHSARIFPPPTPYDYYGYSFGQISPDGLYAPFSSNWNFTLTYATGTDPNTGNNCAPSCKRIDTFIASLPATAPTGVCTWHTNPSCN